MKDQLVSYEIAKLANEKGFNHMKSNCYGDNMAYQEGELINTLSGNTVIGYILAPTQSLLQKWLRETKDKVICVYSNASGYLWSIDKVSGTHIKYSMYTGDCEESGAFTTYELALEKGLQEALKLIKS